MRFSYRTKAYLKEMDAVLIGSKYKVFDINYSTMKAFVNKQDTYRKRNGKVCHVEHHFGKWVSFSPDLVKHKKIKTISYDSSIHGLEEITGQKTVKYLDKQARELIISNYKSI